MEQFQDESFDEQLTDDDDDHLSDGEAVQAIFSCCQHCKVPSSGRAAVSSDERIRDLKKF